MTNLSRLLCLSLILIGVILVWARADACAQLADAGSKGTGSISGKVTIKGKPAAGIPVVVLGGDPGNRGARAQATTDSEGRYRLLGLSAAQYQVTTLLPVPSSSNP